MSQDAILIAPPAVIISGTLPWGGAIGGVPAGYGLRPSPAGTPPILILIDGKLSP